MMIWSLYLGRAVRAVEIPFVDLWARVSRPMSPLLASPSLLWRNNLSRFGFGGATIMPLGSGSLKALNDGQPEHNSLTPMSVTFPLSGERRSGGMVGAKSGQWI
jgi:hypothetical protein